MRVLVYPQSGFISDNLVGQLKVRGQQAGSSLVGPWQQHTPHVRLCAPQRSGHEVIVPACEGSVTEVSVSCTASAWLLQESCAHEVLTCCAAVGVQDGAAAWSAALQQAAAVFHVLHRHERHAKQTLLQLLQSTVSRQRASRHFLAAVRFLVRAESSTCAGDTHTHPRHLWLPLVLMQTPQAPVTFVGISTPLTWTATPAAPPPPPAAAAAPQAAGEPAEQQGPAQEEPPGSGKAGSTAWRFTAEDAPRRWVVTLDSRTLSTLHWQVDLSAQCAVCHRCS